MPRRLTIILTTFLLTASALAAAPVSPRVNARAWFLVDHHSGAVLAENASAKRFPPGHLNKLMVAYGTFRAINDKLTLDEEIEISAKAAAVAGPRLFVPSATQLPPRTLLPAMIVGRANDAAVALAERIAGSEQAFVDKMNRYTAELGLSNTHYRDATGLETNGQYTTAQDTAILVRALIDEHPQHYAWFAQREFLYRDLKLYNRNALLWRDDNVDGVMAFANRRNRFHMVASARHGTMRLTVVVLDAPGERAAIESAQRLLKHGFDHYETRRLYQGSTPALNLRVWLGGESILPIGTQQDVYLTLRRGTFDRVRGRLRVDGAPYAPVVKGQQMGMLTLYLDQDEVGQRKLIALKDIGSGGLFRRSLDRLEMWLRDIPGSKQRKTDK